MAPLLQEGEGVLANPFAYTDRPPQVGDIVIARHPFRTDVVMVKRVTSESSPGRYEVRGDNLPESTDSRYFGPVRQSLILGKVVSRFPALFRKKT